MAHGLLLQKGVNSDHRQHPCVAEDLPGEFVGSNKLQRVEEGAAPLAEPGERGGGVWLPGE